MPSNISYFAGGFMDCGGRNAAAMRRMLSSIVELAVEHHATASNRPPVTDWTDWRNMQQPLLAELGVPWGELISVLRAVAERSINLNAPGYIGHMQTAPTVASIAADWLVSTLNRLAAATTSSKNAGRKGCARRKSGRLVSCTLLTR